MLAPPRTPITCHICGELKIDKCAQKIILVSPFIDQAIVSVYWSCILLEELILLKQRTKTAELSDFYWTIYISDFT